MYEQKTLQNLDEYFKDLNSRREKGVYFYRINGFDGEVDRFIRRYYETARRQGAVIEGKLPNPDENHLAYYEEIMGLEFKLSVGFLTGSLKKWLPRMNGQQLNSVAASIYDTLDDMRRQGKNENMLKNAYIKFMCWLYYRFEGVVSRLGGGNPPKLLYEGNIGAYELKLITVLANSGCDVVLLQYQGDQPYLKLDSESKLSHPYEEAGLSAFPEGYCLEMLRKEMENEARIQRLYGGRPDIKNCTSVWISGTGFEDILKPPQTRGTDASFFYNCLIRINGVEDKLTYLNELYQFQLKLKNQKRNVVIVENAISQPTPDEIGAIIRHNYTTQEELLTDLSRNIQYGPDPELRKVMVKAFAELMTEEGKRPGISLNRLKNQAVYQLCWLKRYQQDLFCGWSMPQTGCLIYLGGCKNENEALFLRMLSRLPVDVLILNPDLNTRCCLEDQFLYEKSFPESLFVDRFPRENSDIHMGTAAYHAERELDTLMYADSGLYRNQQYEKAVTVTLNTMYEEIAILWNQELKYRPNFSVVEGVVTIPVLFAKISGVKNGEESQYWSGIRKLLTEDTLLIKNGPFIEDTDENPVKPHVTGFLKNGRLLKNKIKSHKSYQYGFLREEMQDYLLDKLQALIDQRTIKGTFENGMEYTIVSTVLNLKKDILRLLQKFDFTRKNPKLIYLDTTENLISLEDGIMTAFLNLAGFDVVFFVPTGYKSVERHFNRQIMEEHQAGEYIYDLQIPDFTAGSFHLRQSWREKIFKRGN